jgi:hypothetical protein
MAALANTAIIMRFHFHDGVWRDPARRRRFIVPLHCFFHHQTCFLPSLRYCA